MLVLSVDTGVTGADTVSTLRINNKYEETPVSTPRSSSSQDCNHKHGVLKIFVQMSSQTSTSICDQLFYSTFVRKVNELSWSRLLRRPQLTRGDSHLTESGESWLEAGPSHPESPPSHHRITPIFPSFTCRVTIESPRVTPADLSHVT